MFSRKNASSFVCKANLLWSNGAKHVLCTPKAETADDISLVEILVAKHTFRLSINGKIY